MISSVKVNLIFFVFVYLYLGIVPLFSATKIIEYEEDTDTNFDNPERGDRNGNTLERSYMDLENFNDNDVISQNWLDDRRDEFQEALRDGKKLVPRFHYMWGCETHKEAPLDRILKHIEQLEPLLRENSDLIALVETGFIGLWGEWHYFGCNDQYDLLNPENQKQILFKLLSVLPEDRMVVLRYNWYKREIFGTDEPLGPDSAFSGSYRARVGHQNDCFGYNESDRGTYQGGGDFIEDQKNYLSLDNRYVPQEGETCGTSSYSACGTAEVDLERMHWDFVSSGGLHGQWEDQGCEKKIHMYFGYRIALRNAALPDRVRTGDQFIGSINLQNVGWGKIYNPRGCELVFKNVANSETITVPIAIDPRRWCMTDSVVTQKINVSLPADMEEGTYKVYLNLPDISERLHDRKEYSIRLANKNVWEDATGYNSLDHEVFVSPTVEGTAINHEDINMMPKLTLENLQVKQQGKLMLVTFDNKTATPVLLEVLTLSGSKVWSQTLSSRSAGTQNAMVEGLSTGMYMLKATFQNSVLSENVIPIDMNRFMFLK